MRPAASSRLNILHLCTGGAHVRLRQTISVGRGQFNEIDSRMTASVGKRTRDSPDRSNSVTEISLSAISAIRAAGKATRLVGDTEFDSGLRQGQIFVRAPSRECRTIYLDDPKSSCSTLRRPGIAPTMNPAVSARVTELKVLERIQDLACEPRSRPSSPENSSSQE